MNVPLLKRRRVLLREKIIISVAESTGEDEDNVRGLETPNEGIGNEVEYHYQMTMSGTSRGYPNMGGYPHGVDQHLNFDPEDPPPAPSLQTQSTAHQTMHFLDKPEIDKKVKVRDKFSFNTNQILFYLSFLF